MEERAEVPSSKLDSKLKEPVMSGDGPTIFCDGVFIHKLDY